MPQSPAVLRLVLEALRFELAQAVRDAQATIADATDPENKAENKYDTRGLEASYLARGQSLRVAELGDALAAFETLSPAVSPTAAGLGCLVTLQGPEGDSLYFLGPSAGGTEVVFDGREVLVVTPASPLGMKLVGRRPGDRFQLRPGGPELKVVGLG